MRAPDPTPQRHTPNVKAQEAEAVSLTQVYDSALLLIHLKVSLGQRLAQLPIRDLRQSCVTAIAIHQHDEIIRKPGLLEVRRRARPGGLLQLLQHLIYVREIDVGWQWGEHTPLRHPTRGRTP